MDKIKYLTEKIKSLAVEVDILEEEISAANVEDIKNLQQVRLDLSALETDLKNAISTNEDKITSLQTQSSAQQTEIEANKEDIALLQTLSSSQGEQIETNKSDITANSVKIATNTTNIATNASKISESANKIATNASNIETNATNISENSTKIAQNVDKIAANSTKIAQIDGEVTKNTKAIAANASDISSLSSKVSANENNIESLSSKVTTNGADIGTLSSKITEDEADILSLDNRLTASEGQLSTLSGKVNKNETDIATLSDDVETSRAEISTLSTKTTDNETKIAANETKITENSTKIAQNVDKIAANSTKITQLDGKIAQNTTDIAQNTSKITQNATKIEQNETNIAQNATNITKHSEGIVKIGERLFNLDTNQSTLSTSLENHKNEFYVERNKLQNITGEFYGENLLQNPYLTCNQRNVTINQATECFMADRWFKACTNQVKVNVKTSGIFELRFLKALTEPVRAIEQRIDIPVFFAGRNIVASLTMTSCTSTPENSGCFGLEFFDSSGGSLGVEFYKINTIGDKYLKCTIPENTTSMTFFFQINPAAQRAKLMRFSNPKVEFGTIASKFGGRSDDYELSLCQKYYYASGVSEDRAMTLKAISATEFEPSVIFLPTKMAKAPAITLFSPTNVENTLACVESGGADITVSAVPVFDGRQCFKILATNAVVGNHYKLGGFVADAETLPLNVNITDGTATEE